MNLDDFGLTLSDVYCLESLRFDRLPEGSNRLEIDLVFLKKTESLEGAKFLCTFLFIAVYDFNFLFSSYDFIQISSIDIIKHLSSYEVVDYEENKIHFFCKSFKVLKIVEHK